MKVVSSFSGRWTSFFATAYSIELEFFDEYLFRRLGEAPLNATVLTDAGTHGRLWTSGDPARRLRRANRDYLLRPVLFGVGAFHPKTFLFGNSREGVLLVGSGNLTGLSILSDDLLCTGGLSVITRPSRNTPPR